MKRMEYSIISVAAVAILAVIAVGCAVKTPTENNSKVVTGVSLSVKYKGQSVVTMAASEQ